MIESVPLMLNNKWHFAFDEETRSITMAITGWTRETENQISDLFFNCTPEQIKLAFEMIETAYLLSLIEVQD